MKWAIYSCFLMLVSSCVTVEQYYVRNFSTDSVIVYMQGEVPPVALKNVKLHNEDVINAVALSEMPYTVIPVITNDSLNRYSILIPPRCVAYMGQRNKTDRSLNKVKFLKQNKHDIIWNKQETVPADVYYFDMR
jgi:hypothetical protein